MAKNGWQVKGFEGFANIPVSDELVKSAIEITPKVGGDLTVWLASVIMAGYKFALSYNPERDWVVASLYGLNRDCPNAGFMLTSESAEEDVAIAGLIAKYRALQSTLWGETVNVSKDEALFR